MWRRRPRGTVPEDLRAAFRAFTETARTVEEAKIALMSAVPRGRPGAPLAEALAGYEAGIQAALGSMPAWSNDAVEACWRSCCDGLREALRRAERLRLQDSPEGYEELVPSIHGLLEPLEAFGEALERFRELGIRA